MLTPLAVTQPGCERRGWIAHGGSGSRAWLCPGFFSTGLTKLFCVGLAESRSWLTLFKQAEEPCWAGKEPREREMGSGTCFQERRIPLADLEGCCGVGRAGEVREEYLGTVRGARTAYVLHGGTIL